MQLSLFGFEFDKGTQTRYNIRMHKISFIRKESLLFIAGSFCYLTISYKCGII